MHRHADGRTIDCVNCPGLHPREPLTVNEAPSDREAGRQPSNRETGTQYDTLTDSQANSQTRQNDVLNQIAALSAKLADAQASMLSNTTINNEVKYTKEHAFPTCGSLDANDFRIWKNKCANLIVINGYDKDGDDAEQARRKGVVLLKNALEGDLAKCCEKICSTDYKKATDFLEAVSKVVITPAKSQMAKVEFRAVTQNAGEEIPHFAQRLQSKFCLAFPSRDPEKDEEIKETFIAKLSDIHLSRTVMQHIEDFNDATLDELVQEASRHQANDLFVLRNHGKGLKEQSQAQLMSLTPQEAASQLNAMSWKGNNHSQNQSRNKGRDQPKGRKGAYEGAKTASEKRRGQDGVLRNRNGTVVKCFICERNHFKADCPKKPFKPASQGRPAPGVHNLAPNPEAGMAAPEEDSLEYLESKAFQSGN